MPLVPTGRSGVGPNFLRHEYLRKKSVEDFPPGRPEKTGACFCDSSTVGRDAEVRGVGSVTHREGPAEPGMTLEGAEWREGDSFHRFQPLKRVYAG